MQRQRKATSQRVLGALAAFWLGGVVLGSWAMLRHEFQPGGGEAAPVTLSPDLAALADPAQPEQLTLYVAVHPDCPCTAATLEQIDRLLTKHPKTVRAVALFWTAPGPENENAVQASSYWKRLRKLENATVFLDPAGARASQLGARVSGAVVAYDSHGALRFQGGLTASRGHAVPNHGYELINAIAEGEAAAPPSAAASFGCSLSNEPST